MAALAMTPKLLGRISNENYQEKDKWRIDDIALGPANELLISGHNQKIPKTFISMHKESFGKYQNRPEFSKTFRQSKPVDQFVLFLEGSIIGLKVESALRFLSTENMVVSKTLNLKRSLTCVCFYRGKLYAASSSSTTISVCNLDSEEKSDIILSDMKSDCVLEIMVVMEKIYVCTKNAGRALVFSMTGSKEMEFKNAIQTDAMATSICIHERTELVFVSWNNFQIQLYSQKSSQCLRAFDITEELHKIRVTSENKLVTLSSSKCIVTVYDVARTNEEKEEKCCNLTKQLEAEKKTTDELEDDIDRRKKENKDDATEELENTRLNLSSKEADLSDVQAKLDAARTESDDLRRMNEEKEEKCCRLTKQLESERKTTKKFNERIRDLEGMRTELEIQQKKLKNNLEEEKEKVTCAEGSRVQVVTNLKKVEERNTKLEAEVTQLKERLLAEEKTAKEMQTSSLKVETNLRIEEERNTKLEAEVTQLKERLLAEENIAKEMQTSTLKLNERIKDLEDMRTELESQQKKLKDNLEEEKVTRGEGSRVQERIKYLEGIRTKLESEQKELKDKLEEEKKKATTSIEKLERAKEILEKEKEHLYIQLSTEKRSTERQKAALSKSSTAKHYDSMKSALLQIQNVVDKSLHSIDEHQIIQVNPLDSMQGKDNLERRTSSRRTGKISRFLPKMRKRYSREIVGTQVEKMQQEERGYSSDSTFDSQSTSGYEAASEFESGGTFKSGSAAKIQHDKPSIKTDPATDHESTSGYETASEFEWERTVSPGSASKQHDDEPNFTSDSATDYEDAQSYLSDNTSDTATVKGDSDEEESLDEQSKLEVCTRVSVEGANLQIADTGVSLAIPPGALSEEQTIHMKIMPQPCDAKSALKFECNSAVVVELEPNNCRFQCPVSLTLPHCLQLKKEYKTNAIDVLISHHDKGLKPKWEILHDAKFNLCEENCTISLQSFCWVTYEIHDTIVEAKRIKLYTAGKKMRLNDRITEVEVGFYPDLPGSGKILELNKDMHLSQRKPYVFLKTGEEPLLINLHKVVPKEWNNSQPDENPKIIPFDSVSISEERSCPFVLERSGDDTDIPLCIFKVGQKGRNEVELTIRPEILTT